MDAPLLDALRRRAASTRSEREAGCLKAEIGIYLARTGQLDEARELVNQIRQRWGQGQDPEVFGWVAVLEALMARPGVVLSRAQLEEKLYSWKDEINSNAVEVYVHGLRRKLGTELIQTVRGLGYALQVK